MSFVNTIDLLGDETVMAAIVDKTITEMKDNVLTTIGDYSFHSCSLLKTVDLPAVTDIGTSAFFGCSQLEKADFSVLTSIKNNGFWACKRLTALILRGETVAELKSSNSLRNTAIANGTGYIYVPAALIDGYKSATNWSTHSAMFRALEDYTVDGTITGELDGTKI